MKSRFVYIYIVILIILASLFVGYVVNEHNQQEINSKEAEIKGLKKAIGNYQANNKELLGLNEKLEAELEKANVVREKTSITGFTIGDKSISTEKLLEIFNSTLGENIKLQTEINRKESLLNFVRKTYGLKIEDSGREYSVSVKDTSVIKDVIKQSVQLETQVNNLSDELDRNKYLLKFIEDSYGLKGSYTINEKHTNYKLTILPSTKIDSALRIYPYYKHKLFKNKKGEWMVK